MKIILILLGTSGCHLCEEAEQLLANLDPASVEIDIIDIAEQTEWQEQYAIRIPVLFNKQTGLEIGWPFTEAQIRNFIREINDQTI